MYKEVEKIREQKLIVFDLITMRYKDDKIRKAEASALEAAVDALEEQRGDTQDGHILAYIARNFPLVHLFRDAYTMRALKAGLEALQRKEEELKKRCRETNSQFKDDYRP